MSTIPCAGCERAEACELIDRCLGKSPLHDDYKQLDHDPDKIERCPVCGSQAKLWQYSTSSTAPRQLVVMCEHSEAIGPQDGIRNEGCLLYMPPEEFYQGRITDAVRYWNDFAKALGTLRRGNNWRHANPLRANNAGPAGDAGKTGEAAHSKSEYKRRVAMGDPHVAPPAGVEVRTAEQLEDGFPRLDEQGRRITRGVTVPLKGGA